MKPPLSSRRVVSNFIGLSQRPGARASRPARKRLAALALAVIFCAAGQPARAVLPSGWAGASIGTSSGSESYTGAGTMPFAPTDTFTVVGSGNGPQPGLGIQDDLHFTYMTWTGGDVEIVARVASFTCPPGTGQTGYFGSVGLMIRQTLGQWEPNKAAVWYWPAYIEGGGAPINALFQKGWGPTYNGQSYYYYNNSKTNRATLTPPFWLKLVRVGNNFGTYWSLDGKDWSLMNDTSGGALIGTGSFLVGFFVDSCNTTTVGTAVLDNVYIGAPRLKYKTSWVGNTSNGLADGYASNRIFALWVKPDGTCYTNSDWDEGGQSAKGYKDGKVLFYVRDPIFGTSIPNSNLTEGTITGNVSNVFWATNSGSVPKVYQTDFNGNNATQISFTTSLGQVGGLAASATRLFVSDITNSTVHIVDLTMTTPTEVSSIAFTRPGPIAYDGTNFWITQCASAFPLTNYVAPTYSSAIKCYNSSGVYQNRQITDVSNPTALAKDPTQDRLYVCDNGPNQNIRYYTGLSGTPTYGGAFGVTGGIWYSSSPGNIYEAGLGDWRRFYGPTGVGVDSSGNIYVACNGTNAQAVGGTDLRKFNGADNSTSTLAWKQLGLEFVGCGDFDPLSDTIYTTEERFTMNYANTAPGSEWSYTAFTRDPRSSYAANDARNAGGAGACGVQIRRLTSGNNVFMYTNRQGTAEPCMLYRFNNQGSGYQGTTATPYGRIYNLPNPYGFKLWIDTNGDGLEATDGSECTSVWNALGGYISYDVDSGGDIWMVQEQSVNSSGSAIGRLPCTGTQTIGTSPNTAVIPQYNPAGAQFVLCPAPIVDLASVKYDKAHDAMFCMGRQADSTWVLARYDNWLSSPNAENRSPRYVVPLPDWHTDITVLAPDNSYYSYMGMGFAGDKVFIADLWGPVRVYDANVGNPVITLNPGPEVSATMGWEDMKMGLNAFKRSTGEYLVLEEDAGWAARNLLYRWTPAADTTAPGTATNLVATVKGHAIALTWTGPSGTVTSYNIYRGTASGSLSLYQSNVSASFFVDTNVTPGTTYYYKVAAVSTVGTGSQSNQASAAAASGQAEFVKYDTTTKGTWNPSGTRVYGADGYSIAHSPSSTVSAPTYGSVTAADPTTFAPVTPTAYTYVTDPITDVRGLQVPPTGVTRTSAYDVEQPGTAQQLWQITLTDGKWHQVSIYLLGWDNNAPYMGVDVLDGNGSTGVVLDSRKPTDISGGKWLVWNVKGNVSIRLSIGLNIHPVISGIFFDAVQTPTPALGWWKLDDTSGTVATDSSGAGNNATRNGGTWTAGAHTGYNGCLTFAGTNSTSNLGFSTFNGPNSSNLTYAMWFKTSTSGVMLGMQNSFPTPTSYTPILYVGTDGKLHGTFNTGLIQTMTSAASVNDNAWHHAAITSDGQVQTMYLDGQVAGMMVAPVSLMTSSWFYFLGGQGYVSGWPNIAGTQVYFNGLVDDMRLYNRVLPNGEIGKLANP